MWPRWPGMCVRYTVILRWPRADIRPPRECLRCQTTYCAGLTTEYLMGPEPLHTDIDDPYGSRERSDRDPTVEDGSRQIIECCCIHSTDRPREVADRCSYSGHRDCFRHESWLHFIPKISTIYFHWRSDGMLTPTSSCKVIGSLYTRGCAMHVSKFHSSNGILTCMVFNMMTL